LGAVLLLIYLQIVLGGIVRHLHAGLVCIDIPLCNGELWPSAHPMQRLHMLHRMGGVLVALAVFWISVQLLKEERAGKWVRLLAGLAPFLVIAQVTLGLLSVTTFLGLVPVTAHLGGGALLLATFVSLWMICRRAGLSPAEISAPSGVQAAGV
ncbi:MAG: COX15/CtaA family protein, partial [Bdellovibrionota bacterium]